MVVGQSVILHDVGHAGNGFSLTRPASSSRKELVTARADSSIRSLADRSRTSKLLINVEEDERLGMSG